MITWPLLADLGEEERRALVASARRRVHRPQEVVFHEGDLGDRVFLLVSGRVAIRVTTPRGDVTTLTVVRPGQSFGELALVGPTGRRTATAQALERSETRSIDRDRFAQLRAEHPSVDRVLVGLLAGQVTRLSEHLQEALHEPAETRVLRRLLALVGDREPPVTLTGLTQDDLASLAGTTRPTANRVLRRAEEDGALRLARGRIEVLDPGSLARRAR